MILIYLWVLLFRAIFWCFAAMIWLCFAFSAWMLVLITAMVLVWFDRRATINLFASANRVFAPPDYLRSRRRRRVSHT
jgi:hypothetical protein